MKLLIIGGTRFVGLYLVSAALARGHQITVFNRGNNLSAVPPGVETIRGDRNNDLDKLQGCRWDAVVDTCGYLPRTVKASAEVLANNVDRYVFISSQSVYADLSSKGVDESAPLAVVTEEQLEEANAIDSSGPSAVNYGKLYGGLKALCERAVNEVLPNRALMIRPGLIVGPDDYTGRFTYWVIRVARGGEVLAPGRPKRFVQFIDVRDLTEWIVRMIERNKAGVYNANGCANVFTMENVLEECKSATESDATFTWVNEDFLLAENVAAWTEMPLWLPEAAPHLKGFMFIDSDKAVAADLSFRPLADTVKATFRWWKASEGDQVLNAGIDRDREQALLSKWHTESKAAS